MKSFDILNNPSISIQEKVQKLHTLLSQRIEGIDRIAIVLYDENTDYLKTFIDSTFYPSQQEVQTQNQTEQLKLKQYQVKLSSSISLQSIVHTKTPRVLHDLSQFKKAVSQHKHTHYIQNYYLSSLTIPIFSQGHFIGFLFVNSRYKHFFVEQCLQTIESFLHVITLLITNELQGIRTLKAAIRTASHMALQRDFETGLHLERMSNFARIIAQALATTHRLTDEYIEHVFLFAPLHDIGKIAIPDHILLKPGKFEPQEFEIMKTHPVKGEEIVQLMLDNFNIKALPHVQMLYHIIRHHHEALDGSGYPDGLKYDEIPLAARIVTIADVFDALTSRRPYKEPWPNDKAFALLQELAGKKFDPDCVKALVEKRSEVELIQFQFVDDILHAPSILPNHIS